MAHRNKNKKAVVSAKEAWERAFASLPDMIAILDNQYRILRINESMAQRLGIKAEESIGLLCYEAVHGLSEPPAFCPHSRTLKDGHPHTEEVQDARLGGCFIVSVIPITDEQEEITSAVHVAHDITKRREAERKLQESEAMLARAQQMAHVGHWYREVFTGKGRWSDETYRIFGLEPQEHEANRQFFLQHIHHDDRGRVDKALRDAAEDVRPYNEMFRAIRPDGSIRWVHSKGEVTRNQDGKPSWIFGTILDITERKQMEDELKRYHEELEERVRQRAAEVSRLAAAVQNAMEGITIADLSWRIDYVNPAFTHYAGYTRDEVIGREMSFLRSEAQDPAVYDKQRAAAVAGKPYMCRYSIRKKDGSELSVESVISPVRDRKGEITNFILVWRDMSEQLKLEEQLRQSQKMEAVGTLAGGIAHDFNNMLAVILGNAELALDDAKDDVLRNYLKQILGASKRSRDLVKQILTFSRKSEGQKKALKLSHLVQETARLLRGSLPSTINIQLDANVDRDSILADPSQIQQVLMNLSTNAAHAMSDTGGTLSISLSETIFKEGDSAPEPNMQPGRYVKLAIHDTGIGVPKEIRRRIFEPFFTTKEPSKGTGMGLAVVFGIVKNLDGAITVDSEMGKGSTFSVFFPVYEGDTEEELSQEAHLPTGSERVLVVDDEPSVIDIVSKTLKRLGYATTTALSGLEGWKKFEDNPYDFDLVITDQVMPDITGMRLAERMSKLRKDLPIILFTGYSEAVSPEKAKAVGINEFLMKPVAKRKLAETVRRVLDDGSNT